MSNIVTKENINIENLIYEVRGKEVMLDSDLAKPYECSNGTKSINLAVKRHINRFPERFMFRLTDEESRSIRFQIETKNTEIETRGGKYNNPYVFTEQGVAMLSSVLKTKVAEEVSIKIMDAFVLMRKYISTNLIEQKYINSIVLEDHKKIKTLENSFKKLEEKKKVNEIYFNGQIYDAYSKIKDILKNASKKNIIIDNYADKEVLDIIITIDKEIIIITKPNSLITKQDIIKYNKQYNNLKVYYDNTFHDRYFIIDNKEIYHCGASINKIGYKTFSITLIGDMEVCKLLIDKVSKKIRK